MPLCIPPCYRDGSGVGIHVDQIAAANGERRVLVQSRDNRNVADDRANSRDRFRGNLDEGNRSRAALRHAFGLTLTRLKRPDEARAEFQKATELEPESPQYVYVYAVSLYSGGRREEAMTVLKKAVTRHPNDRSILSALIAFSRTNGDADAALTYAQRLAVITPDDTNLTKLIDDLRQATKPSAR